jgi:hypothetical protein
MSALDDLARNLATPMPRRRAVYVLGAALVTAAIPGIRPRTAQAGTLALGKFSADAPCSGAGGKFCGFAVNGGYNYGCCGSQTVPFVCCNHNKESGSWCCDEGYTCGPGYKLGTAPQGAKPNCICNGVACGNKCCPKGKDCDNGECVDCTEEHKCGTSCCKPGQFCASKRQSLCCEDGSNYCAVLPRPGSGGKPGKVSCCPSGTTCCANDKRSDCCKPGQKCVSGKCACPDGKPTCGGECCTGGKVCSKGKCCPKNRTNCGDDYCCGSNGTACSKGKCCPKGMVNCGGNGKCCEQVDCCGDTCCQGETVCANGTCCPPGRGFGSGKNARCCPPGTVPTSDGNCCPANDPECCYEDGLGVLCPKRKTCVSGACVSL